MSTSEHLYSLLPAVYRARDAEQGEPLRALSALLQRELDLVEADISRLYDDWFIETCDATLVPYIGELLGVRTPTAAALGVDARAYIANTIAYRRRKGTARVLEQIARDLSGWPAHAVEYFAQLSVTTHVNHVRAHDATLSLREADRLELLAGPLAKTSASAEVRRIAARRGRHNIANVGVHVWRLQPDTLTRVSAAPATPEAWSLDPLGREVALFNGGRSSADGEIAVPGRLRRRPLHDELEAARQAEVDGRAPDWLWFDARDPVFAVHLDGAVEPVDPLQVAVCDLSAGQRPAAQRTYRGADGASHSRPIRVAVDPLSGRIAFPAGQDPASVETTATLAFSAHLGGGAYDRRASLDRALARREVDWQLAVNVHAAPLAGERVATLDEAIAAWAAVPAGATGVIVIEDSATHALPALAPDQSTFMVPAGSTLIVTAGLWPLRRTPDGVQRRLPGYVDAASERPHLAGTLAVHAPAAGGATEPGRLALDGLLISGDVAVRDGDLGLLRIAHTTIAPAGGVLHVHAPGSAQQANGRLRVELDHAVCGPLTVTGTIAELSANDTILDAAGGLAVDAPDTPTRLSAVTVLGSAVVRALEASDVIFTETVGALRRQQGCVRFCHVPAGSRVPRAHRCQPELAIAALTDPALADGVRARLAPQFNSRRHGDPDYAQLADTCAPEIAAGAHDGSEMGAFHLLHQPQREADLRAALDEYLRVGLEVGVFHVT